MGNRLSVWGVGIVILAAACSSNNKSQSDAGQASVTVTVGQEGGEVAGPNGVGLSIPPGALDQDVEITISVTTTGFETLPAVSEGEVFAFEPHGLTFNSPVTISIPHSSSVPDEVAMYTASLGSDWSKLTATKGAAALQVEVDHFSFFFNGREVCGLYRQECCTTADGSDGACAGDSLTCVDDRCLECGFAGEVCCGGSTCHVQDGQTLTCGGDDYCQYPYPDGGFVPDAGIPTSDAAVFVPDAQ